MNAEPERNSPEELEARLTALLLGELSPAEARELESRLAEDPHLRLLRDQLRATIDLVREVSASPVESPGRVPVPPQLSPTRRERVLARIKTVTPAPFAWRARLMEWSVPAAAAAGFIMLLGVGLRLGLSPRFQLAKYIDWSSPSPSSAGRFLSREATPAKPSQTVPTPGPVGLAYKTWALDTVASDPIVPPAPAASTRIYSKFREELPHAATVTANDQASLMDMAEEAEVKARSADASPKSAAEPAAPQVAGTISLPPVASPVNPALAVEAKVPLILNLPAAAFKGTPKDLAGFGELGDAVQDKLKAESPPAVAYYAGRSDTAPPPTALSTLSAGGLGGQMPDASRAKTRADASSPSQGQPTLPAGGVAQHAIGGGLPVAGTATAPSRPVELMIKEKSVAPSRGTEGDTLLAGAAYSDVVSADGRLSDHYGLQAEQSNRSAVPGEPGRKPAAPGEEAAKRAPARSQMWQKSETRAPSEPGMASGTPPTTTVENDYLADRFIAGKRLTPTTPATRSGVVSLPGDAGDDDNVRRQILSETEREARLAVAPKPQPAITDTPLTARALPGPATLYSRVAPLGAAEAMPAPGTPAATSEALGWKQDDASGAVPVVGDTPLVGRLLRPGTTQNEGGRDQTFRYYPGPGSVGDAYFSIDPETRRTIANADPGPASAPGTRTAEAGTPNAPVPGADTGANTWAYALPRLQNGGLAGGGGGGGMGGFGGGVILTNSAPAPVEEIPPPGKPENSATSIDPATGLPMGLGVGLATGLPARAGDALPRFAAELTKRRSPHGGSSGSQVDPATGLPMAGGEPASQQAVRHSLAGLDAGDRGGLSAQAADNIMFDTGGSTNSLSATGGSSGPQVAPATGLPVAAAEPASQQAALPSLVRGLDSNGRVEETQGASVESLERPSEPRPAPTLALVERSSPPPVKAGLLGRIRSALSPTGNEGAVVAFGRSENGPAAPAAHGAGSKPAAAKAETEQLREILQQERVLGKVVDDLDLAKASGKTRGNATQLNREQAISQPRDRGRVEPVGGEASARARVAGVPSANSVKLAKKLAESAVAFDSERETQVAQHVLAPSVNFGLPAAPAPVAAPAPPAVQPPKAVRPADAPVPEPELTTTENAFSTFSLNISDVSFKLAGASLDNGKLPAAASIRSEEFINAFDYRDPAPAPGVPIGFAWERAAYPFAQNRDVLRFSIKTAAQGREAGRPLNLVVLLDHSGSMERADRVGIIREALRVLVSQLQPADKLSIVTFARTAQLRADGVSGPQAAEAAAKVEEFTPEGGTNLEEAMNLAYQTALRHYAANGVNRVVLLTDGAANLGEVSAQALERKVEAHRQQGIALDCFGIGWEGYNDDLLETLTRHGDGRYGFVNSPEEAASGFAAQLAGALEVAASDMKVQVEFNPARVTAYRQVGYAKHQLTKEQFRDNSVRAAQVASAESGNALYVVAVDPAGSGPLATVRARYRIPGTSEYREHAWEVPFTGNAAPLEQASPATRLAVTAAAFSEWLAASPFADSVELNQLPKYLGGVPEVYGVDGRPRRLESMIRQANALGR